MIKTRKEMESQKKLPDLDSIIEGAKATAADLGGEPPKRGVGKPRNPDADEWTRQTFVVRKEYLDKLRDLAYWERRTTKVVLDMALEQFFAGKDIKPSPAGDE